MRSLAVPVDLATIALLTFRLAVKGVTRLSCQGISARSGLMKHSG